MILDPSGVMSRTHESYSERVLCSFVKGVSKSFTAPLPFAATALRPASTAEGGRR